MSDIKPTKQININGKICPYTLIETRDAMKELSKGEILEVECDYEPAATETIPNFCEKKGYPLEVKREGDGPWKLYIERTD